RVLPLNLLIETLVQSLTKLSTKVSPLGVAHAKKTILHAADLEIDQAMALEAQNFASLFSSQDTKEGTTAFVEKRKAVFLGK
ncbi:MAG: enoyl-CoA hydratase-related protein, partial [Pseudobdellovibrionaceae bacterium]